MSEQIGKMLIKISPAKQRICSIASDYDLRNLIKSCVCRRATVYTYHVNVLSSVGVSHYIKASACFVIFNVGNFRIEIEIIFCSFRSGIVFAIFTQTPRKSLRITVLTSNYSRIIFVKFIGDVATVYYPLTDDGVFSLISVFASYDGYG